MRQFQVNPEGTNPRGLHQNCQVYYEGEISATMACMSSHINWRSHL